jgi:hypothetical protein
MNFWKASILVLAIGIINCSPTKKESPNSEQIANKIEVDTTTFEYFLADFKRTIIDGDSLELVKKIRFPLTHMNWENEAKFLQHYSGIFNDEFIESMNYSDWNELTKHRDVTFEDRELRIAYTWGIRNERSPDFPSELEWNWYFLFSQIEGEFKLIQVYLAG